MNRHYYLRGQRIDVEQVDGVVAIQGDQPAERGASPFGTDAAAAVRTAAPSVQDEALAAFAAAGWQFVEPNDSTRAALERAELPTGATSAGSLVARGDQLSIVTDLLNVQVVPSKSGAEAEAVLGAAGLTVVNRLNFAPNLYETRTTSGDAIDAAAALQSNPDVVFAEPALIEHIPGRFTPADPEFVNQWQWANSGAGGGTAGADVHAEEAWDHTFGAGIRIAVVDNSFDAGHEDLAAGIDAGSGFFTAGAGGAAATFHQTTAGMPDGDHGTFCAGMAAARRGNAHGGVGAAPDSALMLVACLGDQVGPQTTLARAIAYAANPATEVPGSPAGSGADIIVSSLGPNGADWALTTTLDLALQGAATGGRGGRGCAIFWAASNGNNVSVSLDHVVSHPDVIAVVRSTRMDREDNAARGPEVDLIAPGVDVVSTFSGDNYGPWTGTSFAAPCAAGCAALALSVRPGLTRDQLRQIMLDTADKIGGVVYDANGHNDDYGFGRVNAFEAVRAAARRVQLLTPAVVFNDIPEGETTARAIVWEVSAIEDLTFEVVTGPTTLTGPAGSFELLLGPSVTVPAPGAGVTEHARLWLVSTGTTAGNTATGTIDVRCVQTGEQWTVSLSQNTIEVPDTAVVMVMDQSGSMDFDAGDGRTRVEVLRESANVLVDLLKPDTGIGVVRFDHDAYPILNVVDAGPEIFGPGRAQAAAAVAGHVANPLGATSIGDGVVSGGTMLDAVAATYDATAMIVLTDGQENSPAFIADVAGSIDDTVFAIGLGDASAINPLALTALTHGTGGYVTMTGVLSPDEHFLLAKYYLQILAGVTNQQIVLDPDGYLKGGDGVKIPIELTRTDAAADVILLSPAPGVLTFTLVTPSGEMITPATAGVSYVTGANVAYYRMNLPHVGPGGVEDWGGTWTAVVECPQGAFTRYLQQLEKDDPKAYQFVATHGLRYVLEVHSRSSLTMTARLDQKDITLGTGLHLVAQLNEFGIPVDAGRVRVRAELTGPAGSDLVKLTDAGNGLFEASYVAQQYGVYLFRVVAEGNTLRGERFTREQLVSGSIYVPRPPEGDPDPPKDDTGTCHKTFSAFLAALQQDSQLAKALDLAMRRRDSSLDALLTCMRKCADTQREAGYGGAEGAAGVPSRSSISLADALRAAADAVETAGAAEDTP
jgi:thermitase